MLNTYVNWVVAPPVKLIDIGALGSNLTDGLMLGWLNILFVVHLVWSSPYNY